MTSEPRQAFVWVWLPGAADPVVAGRLDAVGEMLTFTYGRSYLAREEAIPLYLPEIPLQRGRIAPLTGDVAGCIADAGPDAWGQRVILNHRVGASGDATADLHRLTYLLESGSDRIGALDFQASATDYVPREGDQASLEELARAAERDERCLIAKFSSTTDVYPVVKGEFLAMELARRVALDVPRVELRHALGRDALLIERFDRPGDGRRRQMISALTILGLSEIAARYASYASLADAIRARFTEPKRTMRELFSRIVFNVLAGNTDDHHRNHAAFWDGSALTLTPAYDICPQPRAGGESAQIMAIGRDGYRMSQVAGCVHHASAYLLSERDAREIVDHQLDAIATQWDDVCDAAALSTVDRAYFWRRQFLNPYAL